MALALVFPALGGCASLSPTSKGNTMSPDPKVQVVALLKAIETGESAPVAVINPKQYISAHIVRTR